jgi:tetratricopeptide (TPR) repeat protein
MKNMKYICTLLVVLLLHSCNAEMKTRKSIELVLKSGKTEKYVKGIACMRYISQPESDIGYSKNLIKQLLSLGFFAESINAVDWLLKRYPKDPELYYLRGLGYRNLLQYGLAVENIDRASSMQPENEMFSSQALSVLNEEKVWVEIQTMDQSLTNTRDSFSVLLNRAETFFRISQYDAVLYDLGTLSKMGSANDSLYFTESVSSLYQGGGRKSVEILTDMLGYYRTLNSKRNNPGK